MPPSPCPRREGDTPPGRGRGALAVLLLLGTACAFSGEPQQASFTETRQFRPGQPVTQTFTSRGGPVASFELLVATFERRQPDARLRLVLSAAGQQRSHTVAGADIPDAAWLRFPLPALPAPAGTTVQATLTYAGSDPVAYYVNPADPYPGGALTPGPGDLAFRVGHLGRVRGLPPVAGRVAAEFLHRLAADLVFTILWVGALAALTAVASRGRFARRARPVDPPPAKEVPA